MQMILPSAYTRWNAVLAATIVIALTNGVATSSLPLFDSAIATDLGEGWLLAIRIKALLTFAIGGFAAILIGAMVDRRGPRSALLLGATITIAACLIYSRMLTSPATLYAVHAALGFAVASCGPISAAMIVAQCFDRHTGVGTRGRGLALALGLSAPGLGALIVTPLTAWCLSRLDWQMTAGYLALLPLATIAVISLLIPSHSSVLARTSEVLESYGEPSEGARSSTLADLGLLALVATAGLSSLCFFGLTSHSFGIAAALGRSESAAAELLVALPFVAFGSQFMAGLAADLGRARAALVGALLASATAMLLPLLGIPMMLQISLALVTIGWAAFAVSSISMVLDLAPPGMQGLLVGALIAAQVGAGGIGIWLFGEIRRSTGFYEPALLITAVTTVAGALFAARSSRLALFSRTPAR